MFSQKVISNLSTASWIRAMFEEGTRLKKLYGDDNVYDFSLGNPDAPPPEEVTRKITDLAVNDTGIHRYMGNAGFDDARTGIARYISGQQGVEVAYTNIVMTCGAAAGLNVALKSLLDPGDEVIVFSPYFVEYLFYIENCGGKPVIVPTSASTGFQPDPLLLAQAITPKTKALILNTPNNPTGAVYSEQSLNTVRDTLGNASGNLSKEIYVISDQPYDRIIYDGTIVPPVLKIFTNGILVNSFSKSHSLPGERIGYIAVSPNVKDADLLMNCLIFCNRTLGFVNAPSLMQRVVAGTLDSKVDVKRYEQKRDVLYNHLRSLGFDCLKPAGAFYLFPRSPVADDVEFVRNALKYNILVVPGKGFGCPGHFRMAYCVNMDMLKRSLPAFTKLAQEYAFTD